ncbi:hypothetical protein P4I03_21950 [Bacillus cereus]|nr:hypothetical protein [Bacillus thuringiensis]MEB9278697.1 hypothetical protein [Bacillus cereus]MEB9516173.1 hypothetical protein [Bacillus cereus]MEC2534591.1 hypothetical protein [Bacillus cereus]
MGEGKSVKELEMKKEEIVRLFLKVVNKSVPEKTSKYIERSFRV